MHEAGSLLGGEQSGHFFCGEDYYPYDDALVAAILRGDTYESMSAAIERVRVDLAGDRHPAKRRRRRACPVADPRRAAGCADADVRLVRHFVSRAACRAVRPPGASCP